MIYEVSTMYQALCYVFDKRVRTQRHGPYSHEAYSLVEEKDTNQVMPFMILKTLSVHEATKDRFDLVRENRQISPLKRVLTVSPKDEYIFSRWRRAL